MFFTRSRRFMARSPEARDMYGEASKSALARLPP